MAVSKRTRYEVLRRDNHTCRYCGGTAPDVVLTVDHVTPVALGGTDHPSNLVAACRDCNAGKSSASPDAPLVEDVKQDALRWVAAMKVAEQRLAAKSQPEREYITYMADVVASYFDDDDLPSDWRDSLLQFYRAGLPRAMFENAIDISVSKGHVSWRNKWRYACGAAWTMLRELHDEARAVIEEGD